MTAMVSADKLVEALDVDDSILRDALMMGKSRSLDVADRNTREVKNRNSAQRNKHRARREREGLHGSRRAPTYGSCMKYWDTVCRKPLYVESFFYGVLLLGDSHSLHVCKRCTQITTTKDS